ncbi:MAG TPA: PmoA family protein [Arthrobacter sp.]|nr:PmoA family protein [Arthrobacter sp.]
MAIHTPPAAAATGFSVQGRPLVTHRTGLRQPATKAPRPYLHPVRSLAGTTVTEAGPADHPHHLGLSIAFSDVNGTNFWGGSTFTAASGPVLLANHGSQVPQGWKSTAGGDPDTGASGEIGEESCGISWRSDSGDELAVEERHIEYFSHLAPGSWGLSLSSVIRPAAGVEQLVVSSSAVKGRAGAGYGGIFWRFPSGSADPLVLSGAGSGADAAHGSRSQWLSVSMRIGGAPVSVVLAQDAENPLPWFIRAEGYLGAGPAVAWSEAAHAGHNTPLRLGLHAVIDDGAVDSPARALELLQQHPRLSRPGPTDRTS